MRNRIDVGAALFLILLGAGVIIEGLRLGIGTVHELRPGFLPLYAGWFLPSFPWYC